jgi:UDP-GlcNAc:undecaprenyl-phosphate GlcNAc-1-phosphate transferase
LYFDLILLRIISTSFFILVIGLLDDRYKINVGTRLLFQLLIIIYFSLSYDIFIEYIFNINKNFQLDLENLNLIFTVLCVSFLINAFNYSDGIDGLLTLQTIFILLLIPILQIHLYKFINYDLLFLNIPLFLFLLFNFKIFNFPKLFLGNGGSAMLGFIISFILIYYGYYSKYNIDPELLIWVIAFIVFEFLSTNMSRIKRKKIYLSQVLIIFILFYLKNSNLFMKLI